MKITTGFEIEGGVTLILPYVYNGSVQTNTYQNDESVKSVYHNSNSSNTTASERNPLYADNYAKIDSLDQSKNRVCSTIVTICKDVLVTVKQKGTIVISGQLDGGGGGTKYAGQTAGYHARLILEDNALLSVNGTIKVLGFIDDNSSSDNPAQVDVNSGGVMYMPFVLRDFKGGSIMTAIYNGISSYKYSPFNQFHFMNVRTFVKFDAGSKMYAYANLYAQSAHNTALAYVIGSSQDYLIELASGSYLLAKYNESTDVTDLHFYGGATTHSLILNVMGMDLNSNSFVFPLSWLYNITLDAKTDASGNKIPATYLLAQNFRMLPGCKMTVETGATLDIAQLSVYESFVDVLGTGNYPVKDPAILIVRGTVIADRLGGNVYATGDGAKVTVTESVSVTTYEPSKHRQGEASLDQLFNKDKFAIDVHQVFTLKLKLYYGDNINGYTKINQEYTSETKTASDVSKISMWTPLVVPNYITLTITGNEGYTIRTDEALVMSGSTIVTDEFGNPVFTSYNSATDGARTIYLLLDAKVVFTLPQNKHLSADGSFTAITLDGKRHSGLYPSSREETWYASNTLYKIFDIVSFTLAPSLTADSTISIRYYKPDGIDKVYAEIVITDTYTYTITENKKAIADISLAISGINTNKITYSITNGTDTSKPNQGIYSATNTGDPTWILTYIASATSSVRVTISVTEDVGTINAITTKSERTEDIENTCVTADTLVTLADGTQKRVDQLTYDDEVLVWDFYAGKVTTAPLTVIKAHDERVYRVLYLEFSDGTVVKVIESHGFFDTAVNNFVYISESNVNEYLGHTFVKVDGETYTEVTLENYKIIEEVTTAYWIQTAVHNNAITENMLSITTPDYEGWFDYFNITDEMKYDEKHMEEEIAKYGLNTYEEFAEYGTYEQFVAFNAQYFNILIGRGVVTMDEILAIIAEYV